MKILVTGAAGFIGSALVARLGAAGETVVGIDNINSYYDPRLKLARLRNIGFELPERCPTVRVKPSTGSMTEEIECPDIPFNSRISNTVYPSVTFIRLDLTDRGRIQKLFEDERFDVVVNLAAQAGVRYSIENPYAYVESNVVGFMNLLECARHNPLKHFVYASSSSVYGGNVKTPFSESDRVDNPVSLYAATKKSNELFAHVYSKLYGIPTTGLRFFTVYGPWGRPDMAPMLFANAIIAGKPIKVFNNGNLSRDFTYIDDIIDGVIKVICRSPEKEIPAEVYNIGCGRPMQLMEFIGIMEKALGKEAIKEMMPMQPGDVYRTYADTSELAAATGFTPSTTLEEGIDRTISWFLDYTNH